MDPQRSEKGELMNAKQGIKCGEVVIRSGGVMAILVSGGRLTDGSVKRLQAWKDSPKENAVLILEAEPFFEDGRAEDVKIEIVNMKPTEESNV